MIKAELLASITYLTTVWMAGTMADARQAAGNELPVSSLAARRDTVRIRLARSTVQWKGTKMRGTGKLVDLS
ncbi:hypothetical protein SAMN00120144_3084 [Hymenobacter roseosalivarius DSM 11622]|uniref:Uncharacterized protein n=1 Tax=Hymenobacter roseosalivarius DSM 11622 TaxID=645990 RepID=A0A1W1W6I4_9BACT|nr:hypothetical protein [Hymenobacter roseosalivarius]SMC00704.1 hypothetical protein SAMN00120144_3084 [Hymenobacter roseosalivarius DSM 11622]